MSNTTFPTSIDTGPADPSTSDTLASNPHHTQHGFANDAVIAVETKLGSGSSTPATGTVLSGNGAGTSTWATSLTSYPLTTPEITTSLFDANGNTMLGFTPISSAVDYIGVQNAAASGTPVLSVAGTDTNVGLTIQTKGTGNFGVKGRSDGWVDLSGYGTFTYNANNGNKEFVLNTPVDLTSVISPGMRFKHTRHTVPPTQCMAFTAASSQYATKASPTGITFTGAFTCEAWVYLNSYVSSSGIISRFDGTSGWILRVDNGQVAVQALGSTANQEWMSYQAVPLKRWVHIAGVYTSSSSGQIYINGVAVPTSHAQNTGTAYAQGTGPLQVGAYNSTNFFDGYISEPRVWSVAQSQASIQANMAISIAAQANLVVAIPGAGNFNDISGNGNNLTATNGAIATQAANPFNATEYAIITKVASGAVTVFCGTDYTIPNDTLDSAAYSTDKAPYGFPTARGKWIVDAIYKAATAQSSPVSGTWYNLASAQLSIPSGEWSAGYDAHSYEIRGAASTIDQLVTLSSSSSSQSDSLYSCRSYAVSLTELLASFSKRRPLSLTTQTVYYLNHMANIASISQLSNVADVNPQVIQAESAYI